MSVTTFGALTLILLMGTNKLPVSNPEEDAFTSAVVGFLTCFAMMVLVVSLFLVIANVAVSGKEGDVWPILLFQKVPPVKMLVEHWDAVRAITSQDLQEYISGWEHHERFHLLKVLIELQVMNVDESDAALRYADSHCVGVKRPSLTESSKVEEAFCEDLAVKSAGGVDLESDSALKEPEKESHPGKVENNDTSFAVPGLGDIEISPMSARWACAEPVIAEQLWIPPISSPRMQCLNTPLATPRSPKAFGTPRGETPRGPQRGKLALSATPPITPRGLDGGI
jgi:hypothetical protein